VPNRLHRYYGAGYSHFITTSCYQRLPLLGSRRNRDLFLGVLEQVRRRYRFVVVGYVVMPEHVHLLLSEPELGNPSVVMQAIKQGFARRMLARLRKKGDGQQLSLWSGPIERGRIWQPRFYDFVVFSEKKRIEKLRYMHHNPVKRGLVLEPEQWEWSSYRSYAYGEAGAVLVNQPQRAEMRVRKVSPLEVGSRGAQPSKITKAGAADSVADGARSKAGPAPHPQFWNGKEKQIKRAGCPPSPRTRTCSCPRFLIPETSDTLTFDHD
jgi:putative transposase